MEESTGWGQAVLTEGDAEFDTRDAMLLQTIHQTGSIAKAATDLGRSRAHALSRIETLEDEFGTLVERQRGGHGGGGSQLTETGARVLDRYERLESVLSMAASVPETVLRGTISVIDGELATVETQIGTVHGLHDGLEVDDVVHVRIGADALTVHNRDDNGAADSTSARNHYCGRISGLNSGETVRTVAITVDGVRFRALITEESAKLLRLHEGLEVTLTWKATATRLIPETKPL